MSKIDTVSTAFSIVHTQKEIEKLENKIFNFLEDVQTTQGPIGPRGPQGLKGDKGVKGDKGDQGVKGDKGDPGFRGEQGERGEAGPQGERGADGQRGAQGERGEKGEKGEIGLPGLTGPKGDKGDEGKQGPQGERGERGEKGERGLQGVDGATGADGARGEPGPPGPKGEKGDVGSQGIPGEKGEKGEKGDPGTPAPDYREKFEEALKRFNEQLTENKNTVTANLEKQIQQINRSLSTLGGGGSYKILDNADVDKTKLKDIVGDSILIYNPTKKKFVVESFQSIIDRLEVTVGAALEVQYDKLVDEDPENGFTYVGEALPGTTKGQSTWRIKRIYEFGSDGDLDILWANGSADFDKIWNDRATYTYSAD